MAGPCLGSLGFCVLVCHFEKNHKFVLLCFKQRNVRICGSWRGLHPQKRAFPASSGASSEEPKLPRVGADHLVLPRFSVRKQIFNLCVHFSLRHRHGETRHGLGWGTLCAQAGWLSHCDTIRTLCLSRIKCLCGQINAQ